MKKRLKKAIAIILTAAMAMSVGMPAFAAEDDGKLRTIKVTKEFIENNDTITITPGEEICLEYENGEKTILGAKLNTAKSLNDRSEIVPYEILAGTVIFYQKYYNTDTKQYEIQVDVPLKFHYRSGAIIYTSVNIEAYPLPSEGTAILTNNCSASKTAQGENYITVRGIVDFKYENFYQNSSYAINSEITGTVTINEAAQIIISTNYLHR